MKLHFQRLWFNTYSSGNLKIFPRLNGMIERQGWIFLPSSWIYVLQSWKVYLFRHSFRGQTWTEGLPCVRHWEIIREQDRLTPVLTMLTRVPEKQTRRWAMEISHSGFLGLGELSRFLCPYPHRSTGFDNISWSSFQIIKIPVFLSEKQTGKALSLWSFHSSRNAYVF